jgi:hypothetical protein
VQLGLERLSGGATSGPVWGRARRRSLGAQEATGTSVRNDETSYGMTPSRFTASLTPGAAQALSSASSMAFQEPTIPSK